MFNSLTSFFKPNTFFNFEVTHFEKGELRYQSCTLKKEKGELSLLDSNKGNFNNNAQIKKGQIALVVNTNQVLTKVLQGISMPDEAIVEQAFPNLDSKQFFVQSISEENVAGPPPLFPAMPPFAFKNACAPGERRSPVLNAPVRAAVIAPEDAPPAKTWLPLTPK